MNMFASECNLVGATLCGRPRVELFYSGATTEGRPYNTFDYQVSTHLLAL